MPGYKRPRNRGPQNLATCDPTQVWVVEGGPAPTSWGEAETARSRHHPGVSVVSGVSEPSLWSPGGPGACEGGGQAGVRALGRARLPCVATGHSGPLPLATGFPSVCCLTCCPVDRHQMQENTLSAQEGSHRSNYSVAERFPPGWSGGQWKEKACTQSSQAVSRGPVSATVRGAKGHRGTAPATVAWTSRAVRVFLAADTVLSGARTG